MTKVKKKRWSHREIIATHYGCEMDDVSEYQPGRASERVYLYGSTYVSLGQPEGWDWKLAANLDYVRQRTGKPKLRIYECE